jgi:hypothetical protein
MTPPLCECPPDILNRHYLECLRRREGVEMAKLRADNALLRSFLRRLREDAATLLQELGT